MVTNTTLNIKKTRKTRKYTPKSYLKNTIFETPQILKKKRKKVKEDDFIILKFNEYNELIINNYNVSQLRLMLKYYNQKLSGNKPQKIFLLYNYLKYSNYAQRIQCVFRGYIRRKFDKLRGERNISKFVNDQDFLTLDKLDTLECKQLYSYKDKDGFIYGFDICSLWNLIKECSKKAQNPYNRNLLPKNTRNNIKKIIKLGKIFDECPNIKIEDDTSNLSNAKIRELRAIEIFQKIDEHGFITNANWYLNLNRHQLKNFLRELVDIWNYRAQLSDEAKRNINPTHGNPFFSINITVLLSKCFEVLQNRILDVIEIFVTKGSDTQAKALGIFFVLGALTTVSHDASTALPWLYDSFINNPIQ